MTRTTENSTFSISYLTGIKNLHSKHTSYIAFPCGFQLYQANQTAEYPTRTNWYISQHKQEKNIKSIGLSLGSCIFELQRNRGFSDKEN